MANTVFCLDAKKEWYISLISACLDVDIRYCIAIDLEDDFVFLVNMQLFKMS